MINSCFDKVSVIVPVYNSEKYIRRCLDSIVNQDYRNLEIIVINDASNDESLEILQEYKELDNRIVLVNNEKNAGVSSCRNKGIDTSTGEFISFVDSDDWISKDMISKMLKESKKNDLDIVMCSYIREYNDHSKPKVLSNYKPGIYFGDDVRKFFLRPLVGPIKGELANPADLDSIGVVWGKLFKSRVIKDNGIRFIDLSVIGSGEDIIFTLNCLVNVKRVGLVDNYYYHYWKSNENSITTKYIEDFPAKRKRYFSYLHRMIRYNDLSNEYMDALQNRICISLLGMGLTENSKNNKINFSEKIINYKKILSEDYIQSAYSNLELKYFPIHWRIFYLFNKHRMSMLAFIMILCIDRLRKNVH